MTLLYYNEDTLDILNYIDDETGGFYFKSENGKKCYPEDYSSKGDILIFRPDLFHGVEIIDKDTIPKDEEKLIGRWMAFITTTKMTSIK